LTQAFIKWVGRVHRNWVGDLDDRSLTGLGVARSEITALDAKSAEARWTAHDPRLPRVANANNWKSRAA
jgi:hypothetical protein